MTQDDTERARESSGEPGSLPTRRGRALTLWVILGGLLGGAIGQLLGPALPGDFALTGAIGLGVGVALGFAVGTRRADAKDREIVRRAEDAGDL